MQKIILAPVEWKRSQELRHYTAHTLNTATIASFQNFFYHAHH
jgi:hypothetical protein